MTSDSPDFLPPERNKTSFDSPKFPAENEKARQSTHTFDSSTSMNKSKDGWFALFCTAEIPLEVCSPYNQNQKTPLFQKSPHFSQNPPTTSRKSTPPSTKPPSPSPPAPPGKHGNSGSPPAPTSHPSANPLNPNDLTEPTTWPPKLLSTKTSPPRS